MRTATPQAGFTLRNLLYIALLCGVIGAVPALASGIKHAHSAVRGLFLPGDHAAHAAAPAYRSEVSGPRDILIVPALSRISAWCQSGPDGVRLCRV